LKLHKLRIANSKLFLDGFEIQGTTSFSLSYVADKDNLCLSLSLNLDPDLFVDQSRDNPAKETENLSVPSGVPFSIKCNTCGQNGIGPAEIRVTYLDKYEANPNILASASPHYPM